jgi:hypothetical protein
MQRDIERKNCELRGCGQLSSPNLEIAHTSHVISVQYPVEESLMAAHKPPYLFEAKSADTRISKDEPRVARVDFLLANGDSLVVEVPGYVLERLLVRAKRAIEAAPLLGRGRSTGHSAHSRDK